MLEARAIRNTGAHTCMLARAYPQFAAVGLDESVRLELRKLGLGAYVKTTVVCPLFIDTGMFAGARTRFPRLTPLLSPEFASRKIVQAIRTGRPVLMMPAAAYLIPIVKGLLPTEVAVRVAEWFGVMDSMDEFCGRTAQAGLKGMALPSKHQTAQKSTSKVTPRGSRPRSSPARKAM